MESNRRPFVVLAALAAAGVLAGVALAEGPPDKSSGDAPVTLTLLNANDNLDSVPAVQHFIDRVEALSNGEITIHVHSTNDCCAGSEQRIVRDVLADKAQLAWVGTRVWDVLGVNSFRALHAPMLVDSYALERAVLGSDLPAKMLAGLDGRGVVGLALLGDKLRYPAAARRPLRSPADFRGLRIRVYPSATQWAAMRALGAHPSPEGWAQIPPAFRAGRLQALEIDFNTYESNAYVALAPYVTLNLPLWPRTTVVFANASAFGKLSDQQRAWMRQAASDAAAYSLTTFGEDQRVVPFECRVGMRAEFASPAQLSALRKAFAPVYASLRKDPATADAIDEISALKRNVTGVPLTAPPGCRAPAAAPSRTPEARFPEGVYRGKKTAEDVRRVWPSASREELEMSVATSTWTFRHGAYSVVLSDGGVPGCRHGNGRYSVEGAFLVVTWTDAHGCPLVHLTSQPLKLRWSYDGNLLRFQVPRSTDPLDRVTFAAIPFVRIG